MSTKNEGATLNPLQLPGKVYDGVKNTALIVLPATGTLYFALAGIWGLPYAQEVLGTVAAVNLFLGTLAGINKMVYKNSERAYDGVLRTTQTVDGPQLQAHWKEPIGELAEKNGTIVLKVDHNTSQ